VEAARPVRRAGRRKPTRRKPDRALRSDPYTYVWTLEGFVYTSFVTDVCSRQILGWRVSAGPPHRRSRFGSGTGTGSYPHAPGRQGDTRGYQMDHPCIRRYGTRGPEPSPHGYGTLAAPYASLRRQRTGVFSTLCLLIMCVLVRHSKKPAHTLEYASQRPRAKPYTVRQS
jgi:hypothetical protein